MAKKIEVVESGETPLGGITTRDYFAAEAMNGMLASYKGGSALGLRSVGFAELARAAYAVSDAMIVARSE